MHSEPATYFLSPLRLEPADLAADIRAVCEHPVVCQVLKSMNAVILVLNQHRQIVATNEAFTAMLGASSLSELLGMRPGEAVRCRHSFDAPGGCGTNRACQNCGAVRAVKESRDTGETVRKECTLSIKDKSGSDDTMVLDVHAAPLLLDGEQYTLVTLLDIKMQKHRETLQRTFFHDILNSISGLTGVCNIMELSEGPPDKSMLEMAKTTAEYLAETVYSQRDLLAMEDGRYQSNKERIRVNALFDKIKSLVSVTGLLTRRNLEFETPVPETEIEVDPTLLVRVLVNTIKNALEAVAPNETVTVRLRLLPEVARFEVVNPGEIDDFTALRIFEKHFSTKGGIGRGVGTWSMKLLGEKYLGGKVGFHSADGRTTFYIHLPPTQER